VIFIALAIFAFLIGLPVLLYFLARRGRILRIASAFIAIGVGIGLGLLANTPSSSLPDLPLLGATLELFMMVALPFSLFFLVLYPLALIGFGIFLFFRVPDLHL
jgi:hypothetical protein